MAVYTELAAETLEAFLGMYDIGTLVSFHGIAEGVENSNFLLRTTEGDFILTLFERRVKAGDLPWFLGLMEHLSSRGLNCPLPVRARDGEALQTLAGRPTAITTFLPGASRKHPDESACHELGIALARLHDMGRGYDAERPNALSIESWGVLLESCHGGGDDLSSGLTEEIRQALIRIQAEWPVSGELPRGQIHADLFPDNVFFQNGAISGLIDFYFACTDFFAYDLAICLNAWCFPDERTYEPDFARAMLTGYETVRTLTDREKAVLPVLCQGAAVRFLLTRLYDWINTPANALVTRKDPLPYLARRRHFAETQRV
ncbi:homoserine kinase [Gluconobacter morbifer]|uniref:Homoserine kinase n=1 Tax=Gluconobacter morbifer G707 TaxID=1088869 RepID=G6XIN0_9PROT|nr:homoserine kinase [Gluconobacter morbifer]EHH68670.1 homoserine kinase [Gluconobacter morbifer G707]